MEGRTRQLVYAALFAALVWLFSYIKIPIGPVPITLQTLAVMLAGCVLGKRLGFLSQLLFVLLIAVGIAVLPRTGTGVGALLGPTGGYIFSWPFAAWIIGWFAEKAQHIDKPVPLVLLGNVLGGMVFVYLLGAAWLAHVAHFTFVKAIMVGVLPFLIGDFLKGIAAAFIAAGVARVYPIDRILGRETSASSQ